MEKHDVPMDYIVLRDKVIKTNTSNQKPKEIDWNIIGDKIKEIPVLKKLKNKG
jgi:hypothetical protein